MRSLVKIVFGHPPLAPQCVLTTIRTPFCRPTVPKIFENHRADCTEDRTTVVSSAYLSEIGMVVFIGFPTISIDRLAAFTQFETFEELTKLSIPLSPCAIRKS